MYVNCIQACSCLCSCSYSCSCSCLCRVVQVLMNRDNASTSTREKGACVCPCAYAYASYLWTRYSCVRTNYGFIANRFNRCMSFCLHNVHTQKSESTQHRSLTHPNSRHPSVCPLFFTPIWNLYTTIAVANETTSFIYLQVFDNALISAGLMDDPRSMVGRLNQLLEKSLELAK